MRALTVWTLRLKVGLTLLAWALPLVALPGVMIEALGLGHAIMAKLFGVALVALSLGDLSALRALREGRFPTGLVAMSIVAAAGVATVIAVTGLTRGFFLFAGWLSTALWATAAVAGVIALVLAAAMLANRSSPETFKV